MENRAMEFKLNEYRQGVTDEELLADVLRVASMAGERYLSSGIYKTHGKFSESTFRKRFGSWSGVLSKLGLRGARNSTEMKRISDAEMIDDLKRVSELLGRSVVTSTEYSKHGSFSHPTIFERFGTWASFVSRAGLDSTGHVGKVQDADLYLEIERIWTTLGRQPTTTDMKKGVSQYSLDTFTRRFGGWRNALTAFLDYVNSDGDGRSEASEPMPTASTETPESTVTAIQNKLATKRTTRNINLKLRFTVLQMDKFRCRSCGASPAKNPETELHIDHIVPWSKGGETEIENLQTLCSKCNLGKSNHEFL
jgi:hypothetical protein